MIYKLIAILTLSAYSLSAHSSVEPDSRIRTEVYSNQKVYEIDAAVGRASLIQLEEDESLVISPSSVLGIGDSAAWSLGVRGNNLVLKPTQSFPRTNLIVVTNKRTYAIELKKTDEKVKATYILRFTYPDTEAAKLAAANAAEAKRVALEAAKKAVKTKINTEYSWRGTNKLLAPTAAFDDGRFTKLIYDHAGELPVFYKILPDGSESLLNFNIDENDRSVVVLHEVIRSIRVRLNNEVIEITNENYKLPALNRTGTTEHGISRITKDL